MLLLPGHKPPADVRNAALSANLRIRPYRRFMVSAEHGSVLTPNSLSPGSGAAPAAAAHTLLPDSLIPFGSYSLRFVLTVLLAYLNRSQMWQIFVITGRSLSLHSFTAGSIFFARSTMPGAASPGRISGFRKVSGLRLLTSLPFPQISFPGSGFFPSAASPSVCTVHSDRHQRGQPKSLEPVK